MTNTDSGICQTGKWPDSYFFPAMSAGENEATGGRAITRNLDTFSFKELGKAFDAEFSLQWGFIPYVQLDRKNAADILNSYVNTYIKEEIREEGIDVLPVEEFLKRLHGGNVF